MRKICKRSRRGVNAGERMTIAGPRLEGVPTRFFAIRQNRCEFHEVLLFLVAEREVSRAAAAI